MPSGTFTDGPGWMPSEIHVCRAADGDLIGPSAALLRFAGTRRRGVHGTLAGTVVVPAPPKPSG
jgi:hypothetical protein